MRPLAFVLIIVALLLVVPVASAEPLVDDALATAGEVYAAGIDAAGEVTRTIQRLCDQISIEAFGEGTNLPGSDESFWSSWQGLPCISDNGLEPWCGTIRPDLALLGLRMAA